MPETIQPSQQPVPGRANAKLPWTISLSRVPPVAEEGHRGDERNQCIRQSVKDLGRLDRVRSSTLREHLGRPESRRTRPTRMFGTLGTAR
jgi:hypothetical protein